MVKKLLEGFTVSAGVLASASSFDPTTLLQTSKFSETDDFVAEMAKMWDLEDFGDDEVLQDPLDMTKDARKELLDNREGKEDLDFDGDGDLSRRSGFEGSTGNSTNRSDNTKRRFFNHNTAFLALRGPGGQERLHESNPRKFLSGMPGG